ncbi:MAG: hypothetical protein RIQ41_239 [Candidatus Parcubacteria bacterium]|jgi:heat shock protein HslJ
MRDTIVAISMGAVIIGASVVYANKYSVLASKETPTSPSVRHEEPISPPLPETQWVWLQTELPNGTLVSTPAREQYVLVFGQDGTLHSSTDCNSFTGTYVVQSEVLSISPLASTKKFCKNTLESTYARDLMLTTSYTILGNRLTVNLNRDAGTMVFEKK